MVGSGVVIQPRIAITAAHVVSSHEPNEAFFPLQSISSVAPSVIHKVTGYEFCGQRLALLFLEDRGAQIPFDVPRLADAAAFAWAQSPDAAGVIVGFGPPSDDAPAGRKLMARVGIIPWPAVEPAANQNFQFAGAAAPFGLCMNDSGGPYYVDFNGRTTLVGISEKNPGHEGNAHCGDGGIFNRIDVAVDEIRRIAAGKGIVLP